MIAVRLIQVSYAVDGEWSKTNYCNGSTHQVTQRQLAQYKEIRTEDAGRRVCRRTAGSHLLLLGTSRCLSISRTCWSKVLGWVVCTVVSFEVALCLLLWKCKQKCRIHNVSNCMALTVDHTLP